MFKSFNECSNYLPSLLSFLLKFFLRAGDLRCILYSGLVDLEYVNGGVVGRDAEVVGVLAELDVINLGFVCAAAEDAHRQWLLGVDLPYANDGSLLTRSGEKVTSFVEGHGRDGALMTLDDRLELLVGAEGANLYLAFVCVGNGEHGRTIYRVWVQGAQTKRIVAGVEAVDQREVREIIDVDFHLKYDNDPSEIIVQLVHESVRKVLTCPF